MRVPAPWANATTVRGTTMSPRSPRRPVARDIRLGASLAHLRYEVNRGQVMH